MARGNHPFPSRTRQLSPSAPMVLAGRLAGRVGHCNESISQSPLEKACFFLFNRLFPYAKVYASIYRLLKHIILLFLEKRTRYEYTAKVKKMKLYAKIFIGIVIPITLIICG